MSEARRVVVVTGLSGAGKSTALHALEDLGYFCVDNLPTPLMRGAVEACETGGIHKIALGIDVRVRAFLDGASRAIDEMRTGGGAEREVVVLFLDASDEALLRRFSETRRPHPVSADLGAGTVGVLDGIHIERERLAPLRAQARVDLDTTLLSVHELRRQVIKHLGPGKSEPFRMTARFMSFGYKYDIPVDADVILDVRFLDNPFFVPELRALPGTDAAVQSFLLALPETTEFLDRTEELLAFCLPRYEREGKSYLTVGIGCTGGRHQSVALATLLSTRLRRRTDLPLTVVHRDVLRAAIITEATSDPLSTPVAPSASGEGSKRGGGFVSEAGQGGATSPDVGSAQGRFDIINVRGLHARAATKLVQLAGRYRSEIVIAGPDGQEANAKSVMGVLLLCGSVGTVVEVRASGADASSAVDAIGDLIANRFGEPE